MAHGDCRGICPTSPEAADIEAASTYSYLIAGANPRIRFNRTANYRRCRVRWRQDWTSSFYLHICGDQHGGRGFRGL